MFLKLRLILLHQGIIHKRILRILDLYQFQYDLLLKLWMRNLVYQLQLLFFSNVFEILQLRNLEGKNPKIQYHEGSPLDSHSLINSTLSIKSVNQVANSLREGLLLVETIPPYKKYKVNHINKIIMTKLSLMHPCLFSKKNQFVLRIWFSWSIAIDLHRLA